jgi:HKD family nuclease
MEVNWLFQPSQGTLGNAILKALSSAQSPDKELWIVAAWAKLSGIRPMRETIEAFKERGGKVTAVVGIDLWGTTKEALVALLEICTECFVVYDNAGACFHLKSYLVRDGQRAALWLGSGNLTNGGLFTNFEHFAAFDLDLEPQQDRALFERYLEGLQVTLANEALTKRLDSSLIEDLVEEGLVLDESAAPRSQPQRVRLEEPEAATVVFSKQLSPNDCGETGSTQFGVTVPKLDIGFFPVLDTSTKNPEVWIEVVDEGGNTHDWRFIYFNNKFFDDDGTRDEYRLTSTTPYLKQQQARGGQTLELRRLGARLYSVTIH